MMSGTTSRARAQAILIHWRDNIFGFDGQLLEWFNRKAFTRIEDFGILDEDDIEDINYLATDGSTSQAPKPHRVRFKAAVGYFHYVLYYHNDNNTLDILHTPTINTSSFDRFFTVEFDPKQGIVRYTPAYVQTLELNKARIEREIADKEKLQAETTRISKLPPQETAADRFQKGIKRDPAQYKTFQNELYWDSWFRGFSATAKAQGLDNVLNATYVPNSQSDDELFASQQTYMYSVLIDRLQTDTAQSILREHEADKDAQRIIAKIVDYYEKSSMAKKRASTLFSQITSMKIHTTRWNGTMRTFILHWVDKVREYHRLSGSSNTINDTMKKTILMNLVKNDPKLNDVILRDMQRQRDGEPEYPYEVFLEHLLQTADIIDGAIGSARKTMSTNVHEQIGGYDPERQSSLNATSAYYFHEQSDQHGKYMDDDQAGYDEVEYEDDININLVKSNKRRDFGPTLDRHTWSSLNKDDQRAWNSVSPDGREKITKFFNKKKTTSTSPSKPPPKSMSLKTMEQELQTIEDPRLYCDDGPDGEVDETQSDEAEIILNRAQQEGTGRKFLTKFLGKKPTKQPSPKTPYTRDINCTRILYRVSNNEMMDTHERGGLVDRGANGGMAGKDLKVIATTERWVDITGINDIRIDNIRIGTVGGVVKSQKGPIIAIFHQYALGDHGSSIHSSGQLEHYKNRIDDRSIKVGGTQTITTIDGYVLPLDIINGLPHLKSRPFSEREWQEYPHVVMTSDVDWNPSVLDNIISTKPDWYASVNPKMRDVISNPFDDVGEYTRGQLEQPFVYTHVDATLSHEIPWSLCVAQLRNLHKEDQLTEEDAFLLSSDISPYKETTDRSMDDDRAVIGIYDALLEKATRSITHKKYEEIRPYFLYMPKEIIEKTLGCTTQYYRTYVSGPLVRKTYKSPFPALNVMRRPESVFTDTIFGKNAPAIFSGGVTMAQIFIGRLTHFLDVYGIKSENQFVNTLLDTIRKRGAMDKLCSDSARVEVSERVLDVLRAYHIDDWQSEPYYHHQNFAEGMIGQIKDLVNRIMNNSGAEPNEWLLVLQYVAFVWNRIARKALNYVTPYEKLYGCQPDIRIIYKFPYRCPVYYAVDDKKHFPADTNEEKGHMVGFAEFVGHGMTYLVLTRKGTVIPRSQLRRVEEVPKNIRAEKKVSNAEQKLPNNREGPDEPPQNKEDEHVELDTSPKRIRFIPTEDLVGRAFLLDEEETGERKRATILKIYNDHVEKGREHQDLIKVRLRVGEDEYDDLIAYNEVLDFIQDDYEVTDGVDTLYGVKRILDHYGPVSARQSDPTNKMKKYEGSSWNVLIEWSSGERSWEPLKNVAIHMSADLAEYAEQHQLLNEDGWRQFKKIARRKKKLQRLFKQEISAARKRSPQYMFGVQIPRNHKEAMELDAKNGNTKWRDAEKLEINQLQEYNTFKPCGYTPPEGYKLITIHIVYAVKHDGRHKARIVAGGHLTGVPTESTYSGVISLRGMRLLAFVTELNGLNLWATDVGNAYLEALTTEKLYIKAGPEFGKLSGQYLTIYKALYGLKTSGKRWYERLFDVLSAEGWTPCIAEPEIWMRRHGNVYEYIGVYVDDMALGMIDPESFARVLQIKYSFKLKGTGPISYHLGAEFFRDKDGVLVISPRKYIERMISNFERMFMMKPKQASSPIEKGDHPEIDTSDELDAEGIAKYQSLMGSTNWVVQLGRFDVATANMTMSGFRANPRHGHLTRVFRIYGYLRKMNQGCIRVDTSRYDFEDTEFKEHDWERSVYKGAREMIPGNVPKPLGKEVDTITFHDANLYHDIITGRSVTGIIHFINRTPIDWFSKKQNTVETSTYRSEYVASRIAAEQIIDLRNTLRYMGIPIGRSILLGDNQSVVNSSMQPQGKLTKRHMALSFHRVRECIAAKIFTYLYIPSAENPADILSKHWGYNQVWETLRAILFSMKAS